MFNPNETYLVILDNFSSQFSVAAIEIYTKNRIEILRYILQRPDIVLNKPISSIVDKMIHKKPMISRNSDISRIAFMVIIDHAVETVCTKENVLKPLSATSVIPYN